MDVIQNGQEHNTEFWPIEHPLEPPDEDEPVKCPMPDSSVIKDGRMPEEWFSASLRKRMDLSAVMNKEGTVAAAVTTKEPPTRAVRKRHHDASTHEDHTILTPLFRMPPLHPRTTHNITITQMPK
ncbi:hypothetical protein U1Q18_029783 [Sarracenia purpurea var. burkii]